MSKNRKISGPVFIDLFAGCGGLSLGLEQAGFTPLFVNELNHDAMQTYLTNRVDEYEWLETNRVYDIKELISDTKRFSSMKKNLLQQFDIKEIDLVVGGPPCQGYSGIGHRRSYSVDKKHLPSNTLYQDMVTVVHKLQPKMFLFENVRGLLSARWTKTGRKGEIWEDVQESFRSNLKNYHIEPELIYAKHYGVPQNRPRILMVGVRKDLGVSPKEDLVAKGFLPEPTNDYPDIEELFGDIVDDNYEPGGETDTYPSKAQKGSVQEYFRKYPNSSLKNGKEKRIKRKGAGLTDHEYSKHSEKVVKKFQYMLDHDGRIHPDMQTKKFAQRRLPSKWGESGPTITATSLPDDYVHYLQPRSLTVREWARLQMFPDWYEFKGKRTTGGIRRAGNPQEGLHDREVPKYTQIGNAVPVKLAFEVATHFRTKILEKKAKRITINSAK